MNTVLFLICGCFILKVNKKYFKKVLLFGSSITLHFIGEHQTLQIMLMLIYARGVKCGLGA